VQLACWMPKGRTGLGTKTASLPWTRDTCNFNLGSRQLAPEGVLLASGMAFSIGGRDRKFENFGS
jgi:hypothetical protein